MFVVGCELCLWYILSCLPVSRVANDVVYGVVYGVVHSIVYSVVNSAVKIAVKCSEERYGLLLCDAGVKCTNYSVSCTVKSAQCAVNECGLVWWCGGVVVWWLHVVVRGG